MLILIFEWFTPDIILLKMAHVCRKFYIVSWNEEMLNYLCHEQFGNRKYQEIRFKCAKRVHQCEKGTQLEEDKPRWIIEESTSEDSSENYSSDENALHMRHDGDSSADEENRLKDYLRRNAKEEKSLEQMAKIKEE